MKGAKSATFRFVVAETFFEDAKIAHHGTEIDELQRMHPPLRLGCMRLCRPCPLAKSTKMGEGNKTEKDAKQMKKEREVLLRLIANPWP